TFKSEWLNGIEEGNFEALVNLKYGEGGVLSQTLEFEVKEDMKVEVFTLKNQSHSADFNVTLSNAGNAYEKPLGGIKITNGLGYQVAEIPFSEEMPYIAPGETVELTLPWLNKAIPAGRYTAQLDATYGFTQKELVQEL